MNLITRSMSIFLILSLCAVLPAGCTQKQGDAKQTGGNLTNSNLGFTPNDKGGSIYPIKTDATLTYWCPLNTVAAQYGTNLADIPLYKELEKRTGVKVKFQHSIDGQIDEQFNLLLASGELPDIIEYNWLKFPGGPDKAVKDNVILPLNGIMDQYAPNLKKVLESDAELKKMVKTDSGNYYVFPYVRGDDSLMVYMGPMIRKDWLDDLNLKVPTTLDEWYTALKAFKDEKHVESPLTMYNFSIITEQSSAFVGAFGIKSGFYIDDGKVKFGPAQPAFKDYLTMMKKWYNEGLLDKDFAISDRNAMDAKMLSGKSGATIGLTGGTMGKYLDAMKNKDQKFNLVAAPNPTLNKGEKPKFGQKDLKYSSNGSVAINANSKHKELAALWLDYAYGEEGHMLFNFGIENESYKMVNGYPQYTELITKNPKGLTMGQAMGGYIRANYLGPFVQDKRYMEQYSVYDQQKQAIKIWSDTDEDRHMLQTLTPTPEESSEYAGIMNNVNTYSAEMIIKFIFGSEPMENFNQYVAQLKELKIDRAIELREAALVRYNKR